MGSEFRAGISDHFSIYLIAIFTLGLAFLVAQQTKVTVDFSLIFTFGRYLFNAAILLAIGLAAVQFVKLAVVEKSQSPTRDLLRHLANKFYDPVKIPSVMHMFVAFTIFVCGFSILRASVAVLNPFEWDIYFKDLDQLLHFGTLPHLWIKPLIDNTYSIAFINFIYNTWYFLMLASVFTAGILTSKRHLRLQFLNAYFLTWLLLGFFMATGFSSAGPCFYDRLALGSDYNDLMAALHSANQTIPIWALPVQDMLWDGYKGIREGSVGITAFPSLHVATSVLIATAGSKLGKKIGIALWSYAALIMIGSVALGWHYAVDGYTSAILVPFVWWFSGKLVPAEKQADQR